MSKRDTNLNCLVLVISNTSRMCEGHVSVVEYLLRHRAEPSLGQSIQTRPDRAAAVEDVLKQVVTRAAFQNPQRVFRTVQSLRIFAVNNALTVSIVHLSADDPLYYQNTNPSRFRTTFIHSFMSNLVKILGLAKREKKICARLLM